MTTEDEGRLFVISGPSGVGKDTVVRGVRARLPVVTETVSVTTRHPRPGEEDGQHYHFVTEDTFDEFIATDRFLEWAPVHRWRYGTLRSEVDARTRNGRDVILVIDVAGARQIRERSPGAVTIFLTPPSWNELERRLAGRGTDDEAERRVRLDTARRELDAGQSDGTFHYTIVNDDVDRCIEAVVAVIERR